ncbi:MAG: glutamate racemase [Oscillospiraceae bacterium]
MDTRPIGVFDSGLGGLTAVHELMKLLPGEDIVYFGDTGRVPYGGRSDATIIKYTGEAMRFLMSQNVKAILVACGTASSVALEKLMPMLPVPAVGIVEPTALEAAGATKNGRIGLIATQATIASGVIERKIRQYAPGAQVFPLACPLFVPLVENGRIKRGDIVIETVAAEYLAPLREKDIDTLVLACTHYPLLSDIISDFMGPGVTLVNSGAACAKALCSLLEGSTVDGGDGVLRCCVSDNVHGFEALASAFLRRDLDGKAELVSVCE